LEQKQASGPPLGTWDSIVLSIAFVRSSFSSLSGAHRYHSSWSWGTSFDRRDSSFGSVQLFVCKGRFFLRMLSSGAGLVVTYYHLHPTRHKKSRKQKTTPGIYIQIIGLISFAQKLVQNTAAVGRSQQAIMICATLQVHRRTDQSSLHLVLSHLIS